MRSQVNLILLTEGRKEVENYSGEVPAGPRLEHVFSILIRVDDKRESLKYLVRDSQLRYFTTKSNRSIESIVIGFSVDF